MVNVPAIGLAAILTLALASSAGLAATQAQAPDHDPDPSRAVGSALGKGAFPWYDSSKDQAKPFALPRESEVSRASESSSSSTGSWGWLGWLGNLVTLALFGVALGVLIGLMVWFWRIYEPIDSGDPSGSSKGRGEPSRIEALPEGMRREFESSDPWEEAIRRRDRGDLAGAVVCLFAHQLLTLSRLGLVRIAPGRTGRQLLRSVVDAEFRGLVHPTLRLFEAVYYGHRTPSPEEFSRLWAQAETFERRVAAGVVA